MAFPLVNSVTQSTQAKVYQQQSAAAGNIVASSNKAASANQENPLIKPALIPANTQLVMPHPEDAFALTPQISPTNNNREMVNGVTSGSNIY